ncbi:MAG: heme biosynthesis HemY N-terminal domain-containing protein [Nevskiales bacterium]
MSRTLLGLLIFVFLGVAATLFFEQDNGYVLMRYGDIVVESSLVFFVVALLAGLWALSIVWRSLKLTLGLPRWLPALYRENRERSLQKGLLRGLLLLREGRWPDAEKALAKPSKNEDLRLVNYLNAAVAAQRQNAVERRDYYLQQAAADERELLPLAVMLTRAELQAQAGQFSQALATLELLREKQPDHIPALQQLFELSAQMEDWARVRELWPDAERLNLLNEQRRTDLGEQAWLDYLQSADASNLDSLDKAWQSLPRRLRQRANLRVCYVRHLLNQSGGQPEALRIITSTLKHQWVPNIALLYSEIHFDDGTSQMATVEDWIKQHGEQPELQLLAGQLCLKNKLWGRARSYLESVLAKQPDPRAWMALGRLKEKTDDLKGAADAYAKGLELTIRNND